MESTPAQVGLELFLAWLQDARGHSFTAPALTSDNPLSLTARCKDAGPGLVVEVRSLIPQTQDSAWLERKRALEELLSSRIAGRFALWLPPGADLPQAEMAEGFAEVASRSSAGMQPGGRSGVPVPATLYLRKLRDDGSVISVVGALDRYWTLLSEGARGSFDLDSTELHRLPGDDDHRELLLERIRQTANQVKAPGQWAEIETVDTWTLQRLEGESGSIIIGLPPADLADTGVAIRRNLRRLLAEAAPALRQEPEAIKALVLLGYYPHLLQETATVAIKGYDPALYAGLDFICLAVDGQLKPLIESPGLR